MLDLKEEQKYKQLRKLAQELHIPIPEVFLTLEVFDKDGKLIQKHHQRSHSWVRNAYNGLFSIMACKDLDDATFGAGLLSFKDFTGAVDHADRPYGFYTDTVDGTNHGYRAPAAEDGWGILVGSGVNAEDFEDYVLQTPIVEGTGGNQLNHVESQPHSISYADLTLTNTLVRYFNNNTVGETNVDVNEVALATLASNPGADEKFVFSRDHLASTVIVPSTGQLRVTYTIQLTYPAE